MGEDLVQLFSETLDGPDGHPLVWVGAIHRPGFWIEASVFLTDPATGEGLEYLTPEAAELLADRLPAMLRRAAQAAGATASTPTSGA